MLQSYEETLTYLYEQLPMFSRIGAAAYKHDLRNTEALCAAFGHPERKIKTIHIAGTNGKGSTSHMLAAILHTAGYKVGLYTSPHLKDFRERIKVSPAAKGAEPQPMQMISKDFVVEFTARAEPFIEVLQPSFFELTVVMAFDYFAQQEVDYAIIETGMGGRVDSTNVITPILSIITNISLDHTHILGSTLPEIAKEKAGIIKQGVPVVISEKMAETEAVFEKQADVMRSKLIWAEQCIHLLDHEHTLDTLVTTWRRLGNAEIMSLTLDLPGLYQMKNLAGVLTAVEVLNDAGCKLTNETVTTALQQVKKLTGLHGRWEKICQRPTVILDVCHNEAGISRLVEQLAFHCNRTNNCIHIVFGMVKDKAVTDTLSLFPQHYQFYFTQANLPRAMPAEELQLKALAAGLNGNTYADVNEALKAAMLTASPSDIIVVCGSVFLVGEVDVEKLAEIELPEERHKITEAVNAPQNATGRQPNDESGTTSVDTALRQGLMNQNAEVMAGNAV